MLARIETVESSSYSENNNVNTTLQSSTQITTAFMRGCHFRLPIKLTATPTFTEQFGWYFILLIFVLKASVFSEADV